MHQPPSPALSILDAIGNTPLVKLRKIVPANSADVYVKLEYYNPTGSYKDRMALAIIEEAEKRGTLKPGMRVVEYTGGSTGSSLSMVCAVKGYPFHPLSSDAYAREKLQTMRAFGAHLQLLKSEEGRITPDLFRRFKIEIQKLAAEPNTYYTDQMNNEDAIVGYQKLGRELLTQMGGKISAFCAGVGTSGMLVGVSRALKTAACNALIVALEPETSAFLSTGKAGPHRVEGIGIGFAPALLQADDYNEIRAIPEADARHMARQLAREEGILAGTSSGLNVFAALALARQLGSGHSVVTVACDTGLKYLAGDLHSNE